MKNLILIYTLLQFSLVSLKAQIVQAEFKTDQMCGSRAIAAHGGFIYLAYGINEDWEIWTKDQYLLKLDHQLNIVDSINVSDFLNIAEADYLYLNDIEVDTSGIVYGLFNYLDLDDTLTGCIKLQSLIFSFDDNLQVLDTFILGVDSLGEELYDLEIFDNILLASGCAYRCNGFKKPGLYKMNIVTRESNFRFYDSLGDFYTREFRSPTLLEDGEVILNVRLGISGFHKGAEGMVVLDTNLNIIHTSSVRDYVSPDYRCMWEDGALVPVSRDSVWKIGTCRSSILQPAPPTNYLLDYYNLGATLLDSQYNVSTIDTFPLSGYNYTYGGLGNGSLWSGFEPFDYNDIDSILFVQADHTVWFSNYFVKDTTAFYLYNFNARTGAMNWIKKVQRNYSNGNHNLAALPGNRWVISFNEYNWDKYAGPNLAVHVWILNGNGDIIGEREFARPINKIGLYPNPATDRITITDFNFTKTTEYRIVNQGGVLVGQGNLEHGQRDIDIEKLKCGWYILHIIIDGQPYASSFFRL